MTTPHSTWARYYDEAYRRSFGDLYDALTEVTVESVCKIQPPPARIVDFGAGTGRLALPLARRGYSVVAVDPCAEMLEVLRAKAEKENVTIEAVCCRMQDEFAAAPFDMALCVFTVLLYLLDATALNASLQRTAAALCPGGHLLLDIPSKQLFQSYRRAAPDFVREVRVIPEGDMLFRYDETIQILEGVKWANYSDSFQIRYWEQSEVLDALKRAGFVVEDDLSPAFAGTGANYYVAARPGLKHLT